VAHLETGLVEFGHTLDQCSWMWCYLWLTPLVLDIRRFVHPLRLDMHIHQEPSFLRILPAALEASLDVLLRTVAVQRQPDFGVDHFIVPR
jgi:hypothetical protein